jgi:hypothetical protein
LIELGGLVVKAGLVNLTGDDRATILGALLWMADKLQSNQGEQARELWAAKGKQAFEGDPPTHKTTDRTVSAVSARQWHVSRANACGSDVRSCKRGQRFEPLGSPTQTAPRRIKTIERVKLQWHPET